MLEITNGIIVPDEENRDCRCRLCEQCNVGLRGGKGVKGANAKGWGSCYQTGALWNKRGIILLGGRLSLGWEVATFIANF